MNPNPYPNPNFFSYSDPAKIFGFLRIQIRIQIKIHNTGSGICISLVRLS
jgi:hypothetical protein